ncbi:branched-chain amino acid ABC transporter permease [Pseudonocardia hispaniensis]|uniref:Branched-chain amino acid ABC transporter permease n=1 Tax=Pseudonocardia hispaniensis TaxID=904933 RepID=A0ABW1J0N9_9PSEU
MSKVLQQKNWPGRAQVVGFTLVAVALVLPFLLPPYRNYDFSLMFIYGTAILGLTMLTGASGQISLAQGTFVGVGAYVVAIAVVKLGMPLWVGVLVAVGSTTVMGFAIGLLASRLNGLYLALLTLALAIIFAPVIKRFPEETGGASGLLIPQPRVPEGWPLADDQLHYLFALSMLILAWLLTQGVLSRRPGRALYACQDDPLAAAAMGINVPLTRAIAFAWAGAVAGLAGAGYVVVVGFVSPESFPLLLSVAFLAGLVVGGARSPWGALLGAAYVQFVPLYTGRISDSLAGVVYGISLVVVLLLLPGGLASIARRLSQRNGRNRFRVRRASSGGRRLPSKL